MEGILFSKYKSKSGIADHYSPAHIIHLFGKYTSEVLKEEIHNKRLLLAAKVLKDLFKPTVSSHNVDKLRDPFGDKFNFFHEFILRLRTKSALLKIRRRINQLQRVIDAPKKLRPSYGSFEYDVDSYFIEIDYKGVMRLIETEKGRVREVRRTKDLDELLYWIFTNITFAMACKNRRGNNPEEYDHRMQIFLHQEELLGKLNPQWKKKKHAEHKVFMKGHPKDELRGDSPAYCEELRKLVRSATIENGPNYFRYYS